MTQKANKRYIRRSLKKQRGGNVDCAKCVTVVNMTKTLLETMQKDISNEEDSDFKTKMMTYSTTIMTILTKHEEEQQTAAAGEQPVNELELGVEANTVAANPSNNNSLMVESNAASTLLPANNSPAVPAAAPTKSKK
jgi:hypothetical protein